MRKSPARDATRLSQAQLLVLETPGNALPSPISLHKQRLTFIEGQGSTCRSLHCIPIIKTATTRDFALRLMGGRGRVIERKLIATVRRESAVMAAAVAAVPENSTVVPVGWRSMSVATD